MAPAQHNHPLISIKAPVYSRGRWRDGELIKSGPRLSGIQMANTELHITQYIIFDWWFGT